MADYALIDGYLESMRSSIRWRRDLDDVIAEMEDHLISATERFEERGSDRVNAQQRTLDEFGDPKVLAVAFASTPTGGIAVPTTFTKSAGLFAIVSAVAWIIGLVAIAIAAGLPDATRVDPEQFVANGQTVFFIIGSMSLLAAGALMFVTMIGLYRRHGNLGILGIGGLGVTGLGVLTLLIAWAFPLWMTLIGVGVLLFAISLLRRDLSPRLWTLVWGGGMAVGAINLVRAALVGGRGCRSMGRLSTRCRVRSPNRGHHHGDRTHRDWTVAPRRATRRPHAERTPHHRLDLRRHSAVGQSQPRLTSPRSGQSVNQRISGILAP